MEMCAGAECKQAESSSTVLTVTWGIRQVHRKFYYCVMCARIDKLSWYYRKDTSNSLAGIGAVGWAKVAREDFPEEVIAS